MIHEEENDEPIFNMQIMRNRNRVAAAVKETQEEKLTRMLLKCLDDADTRWNVSNCSE